MAKKKGKRTISAAHLKKMQAGRRKADARKQGGGFIGGCRRFAGFTGKVAAATLLIRAGGKLFNKHAPQKAKDVAAKVI